MKSLKIKKKFNKLKKTPKLFFQDMVFKYKTRLKKHSPIKHLGANEFTVVSAVYNVEKYLDDYFKSLIQQSLDFKKHIKLIMVDDGSTDSSADIIKKWQKKYPDNILYVYKENGGQASARNLGIEYIRTPWCTFMDPDDFLDVDYFYEVDKLISSQSQLEMISCNFIFYFEDKNIYKDTHPQNYRFKEKLKVFDADDEFQFIQLSVNSAFVKKEVIDQYQLRFDTRVKPSFEDATFMLNYALALHQNVGSRVAFLRDAKYFYRKRSDGTSALDTAWTKPSGYDEVLRYGCLQTLKAYDDILGYVPRFVQTSVIYYHIWQIHRIINNDNALSFLTKEQQNNYLSLLKKIFVYIDENAIHSFGLANAWFYHKAGMLHLYKELAPDADKQIFYVEKYDARNIEALFYYFAPANSIASFKIDGKEIIPSERKILSHTFLNQTFIYEYRYWVPLDRDGLFSLEVDGKPVRLGFGGAHYSQVKDIKQRFDTILKYPNTADVWLIMDRDVQADDNAEHFYRYVKENHPEVECYFGLRKNSPDWVRLEQEGFNLLDFGSYRFERILKSCSKIISSHADNYIVDYFKDQSLIGKDFVFLPHGVFQNDWHKWMNSKIHNMSLFITTTNEEHRSIAGDYNHYKYGNKVVKQLGFPRHDALLKNNSFGNKTILVMPTWRKYLIGPHDPETGLWQKNTSFMDSFYAQCWKRLLVSLELKNLVEHYGYQVIFAPHKYVEAYLSEFELPNYIQIWKAGDNTSIQELFQNADLMVTDYSSVAFEMAYLNKLVIYYQFDYDEFYAHHAGRGYFDYSQHGFGPVVMNQEDLLKQLEIVLKGKAKPFTPYKERIEHTFSNRDQNNCQRVFDAVRALDQSRNPNQINVDLLEILLHEARVSGDMALSEERARKLKEVGSPRQRIIAEGILVDALCQKGNLHELQELKNMPLENAANEQALLMRTTELTKISEDQALRDNTQNFFHIGSFSEAKNLAMSISDPNFNDFIFLMLCAVLVDDRSLYENMTQRLEAVELELIEESLTIVELARAMHISNLSLITKISEEIQEPDLQLGIYQMDLNLILSYFYEKIKDFDSALKYLELYLDRSKKNIYCYRKAITYAEKLDNQIVLSNYKQYMFTKFDFTEFSEQELFDYLEHLYEQDERSKFENVFIYAFKEYPGSDLILLGYRYVMWKSHDDFRRLFSIFSNNYELLVSHENLNVQQIGYYALKKYLLAYQKAKEAKGLQRTQSEWEFYAELGCFGDDVEMIKEAFKASYLLFPEANIRRYLNYFKEVKEIL